MYTTSKTATAIRTYEAFYIVDPNLTNEQVEGLIAKYSSIIEEQGGKVTATGKWDKRRLAYDIKHYKEGIYILMFFEGTPAVAKELHRVMRISDDVIRHIILRVEPKHVDTTRIEKPAEPPVELGVGEEVEETAEPEAEETGVEEEAAGSEEVEEAEPEEAKEETELCEEVWGPDSEEGES
ncbi:MAG: 30S ribosomal protein S6 [Armatimonadota bacterium]